MAGSWGQTLGARSMKQYRGASTLLTDDGTEIRAGAGLEGNETRWSRYLTIAAENLPVVMNLSSGRIRLPNGAEGAFDRPNREAPPRTHFPAFRIRIEGNGDAPF